MHIVNNNITSLLKKKKKKGAFIYIYHKCMSIKLRQL
jgi:hypothetical protein